MCNCSSSLWLRLFFNKWLGALQMVGWGNGTVMGIGVPDSSSAAVNILNTGIPGMYGSMDMHYTGMVRMWDVPYRLTSVPSSMNVFFEATTGMKVFVEQEFIYKVHLGGAKFWGDFMVFLGAVVQLQISLIFSKGCKLWLMAFSYVLMLMVVPQAKWVSMFQLFYSFIVSYIDCGWILKVLFIKAGIKICAKINFLLIVSTSRVAACCTSQALTK